MKKPIVTALLLCAVFSVQTTSFASDVGTASAEGIQKNTPEAQISEEAVKEIEEGTKEDASTAKSTLSLLNADINGIFADMKSSLDEGTKLSLSEAVSANSDTKLSEDSLFDLSDMSFMTNTALDMGQVNLEYSSLSTSMLDAYGATDLSGGSQNCMSLFQNTYGDIANGASLKEPTIPEGFTVENMLSSASDAVNSAYSGITNSGTFSSVKGNISIGNIFHIANQGLTMPELASTGTLGGMIASSDEANKGTISSEFLSYKGAIKDGVGDLKDSLKYNVNQNFLNMVDMDNSILNADGAVSKKKLGQKTDDVDKLYKSTTNHKKTTILSPIVDTIKNLFDK